ncbi:unnamed protein product [Closterium sp. NIES-64]|nr:unnamed protein product [Closterium sp. NIES-64]
MRVALEKTMYDARTDVVVCGHVHSYKRTVSVRHLRRCLALEKLLYDARTDVVVCGHVHAYECTVNMHTGMDADMHTGMDADMHTGMHVGMRMDVVVCGHVHANERTDPYGMAQFSLPQACVAGLPPGSIWVWGVVSGRGRQQGRGGVKVEEEQQCSGGGGI